MLFFLCVLNFISNTTTHHVLSKFIKAMELKLKHEETFKEWYSGKSSCLPDFGPSVRSTRTSY